MTWYPKHSELVEIVCRTFQKDKKSIGYYKEYPLFHGGNPSRIDILQGRKFENGINYVIYEVKTALSNTTIDRMVYQLNKYFNYLDKETKSIWPPYHVTGILAFLVTLDLNHFIKKLTEHHASLIGSKMNGIWLYDPYKGTFRDISVVRLKGIFLRS